MSLERNIVVTADKTHVEIPSHAILMKAANMWLDEQHCVLWGGYFVLQGTVDVQDIKNERHRVLDWLTRQIEEVLARVPLVDENASESPPELPGEVAPDTGDRNHIPT